MRRDVKTQASPVLGCSRSSPYTKADFSKDLQVYHLSNQHHPNGLYNNISPNFVHSIELQEDPSNIYTNQMKSLYMDELDHSLNMYKEKMINEQTKVQDFKKQYKENVNGLILYMQREEARRSEELKSRMRRQQERQDRFIDANMIKNKKIDDYINNTQFSNSLIKARTYLQKQQCQRQQQGHIHEYEPIKVDPCSTPPAIISHSPEYIRHLSTKSQVFSQNKPLYPLPNYPINQMNQMNGMSISKKMNERTLNCSQQNNKNMSMGQNIGKNQSYTQRILRVHNPITNPIQYHIDNPYFINKMQRKYGNGY